MFRLHATSATIANGKNLQRSPCQTWSDRPQSALMTVRRTGLSIERQNLGPVRLYREDLRAIAAAVREVGDLKITCDDEYEASEPTDFDHLPERLVKVEISGKNTDAKRSITVDFTQNAAYVNLVEPDTHAFGVVVRIKNICDQKRRFSRILYRDKGRILILGGIISIIAYTAIYAGFNGGTKSAKSPWTGVWLNDIVPLLLLSMIPIGLGIRYLGKRRVAIINALRADRPGYWKRTGDMWVVGIITALLGAIIGYFLGKIT